MQSIIPSVLNLATATACLTLGVVVLVRHPGKVTHRAFGLLTATLSLWALCVLGIVRSHSEAMARGWLTAAEMIAAIMPAVFYTFIGYFPKGHFDGSRRLLVLFYGAGLLLAAATWSPWYVAGIEMFPDAPPSVAYGPAFAGVPLLYFLTVVAIHGNLRRKHRRVTGIERRQIQYVMFAIYGTLAFGVLTNFLTPVFGVRLLQAYGPISAVFLITFFAFAMVRYHLLDARTLLARFATFIAVTGAAAVVLFGATVWAIFIAGEGGGPALFLPPVIAALAITAVLPPLQSWVRAFVEGSILRQTYDVHLLHDRIAEHSAEVLQLEELLGRVGEDIRRTIGLQHVRILLVGESDPSILTVEYTTLENDTLQPIPTDSALLEAMRRYSRPLVLEKLLHPRPSKEALRIAAQLAEMNAYLCLPLKASTGLVGLLTLGQKDSHDIFSQDDLSVFKALAAPLGTAIVNARLYRELEKVNLHLSQVFSQMREGVIAVDTTGTITTVNQGARKILGPVAAGQSLEELTGAISEVLRGTLKNGSPVNDFETRISRAGQDSVPVVLSSSCLNSKDNVPAGAMALLYDLSQVKRLEQNVLRADRLSSIGTLAAGMAHEIKNPLVSIKTFTQLFMSRYEDPEFRTTFNDVVPHEVDRIDAIVSRLLDFARPRPVRFTPQRVSKIIDEVLALVELQTRRHQVAVIREYEERNNEVYADEQQLHQVFLNLVLNGIESMADCGGGSLTLRTELGHMPPRESSGRNSAGRACVVASVSDTGGGIPPDDLDQLFTPFFTTKEKGCGLGLAVVHGIIAEHNGVVDAASTKGKGSIFSVSLPLAHQPAPAGAVG